ncbi:metallophosphoesterase [Infirmifilum sp. NZ]|uniref:metallophosphoesterase n=1 Tax=Infirmifilum sp. NZ TaxID=2926850 RepID=UPI00279ED135|nr:metallophosphoesterase [Infirmifilum sp. NZ]UNQ74368.1 metallophosphoesterase [Infirmifilum sp. NZ]
MKRIAIISDTHDNLDAVNAFLARTGGSIDAIIHAGDIVSPFTLRLFKGFKVYAVFGNNDGEKLLLAKTAENVGVVLEEAPLFLKINGRSIAVIHGASTPEKTEQLVEALARSGLFDIVVYGHTHRVDVRKIGETLVVNPGALSGYLATTRTFAVVDLEKLSVEVIEV